MVLYRATLGIPVYFFRNVQAELYNSYKRVLADKNRSYPLHIEAQWENDGLPDLDPLEQKRASERRQAEKEGAAQRASEEQDLRGFVLASAFGAVLKEESGYHWSSSGAKGLLGADRSSAFKAFRELDPFLRKDLLEAALASWGQAKTDRGSRERVAAEIRTHEQRLKEVFAKATAEQRDSERRHAAREREIVAILQAELAA